jgi:hypothetical protein
MAGISVKRRLTPADTGLTQPVVRVAGSSGYKSPVAYAVENALYQWEEGERALRDAPEPDRAQLERAVDAVLDELRRRLGSSFVLDELAELYAEGTDWVEDLAGRRAPPGQRSAVVDAAFARYAREARNYAGGRARERHERP